MKIMLDAGHGYSTPGKRSPDGFREYEFNRAVANFAKTLLESYKDVTVYFAHSDKRDVPLKERTDQANRLKVDCYVSIHANAFGSAGWNNARGIETYVHPSRPKIATELARKVQRNLVIATGLTDRGVKTSDFHVLRETAAEAILVECGFLTNREELKLLRSEAYQRTCAESIVKGLQDQFKLKPKTVVKSSTTGTSSKTSKSNTVYRVQIGAFNSKKNAEELVAKLKKDGYDAIIV